MPREPFHRLFFAVRPPADAVPHLAELRESLQQGGGVVADEHLHLTTWLFEDSQHFAADAAARAQTAAESLPLTAFRIVLDRMVGGHGHVVLVPSETLHGFVSFQARLDRVLTAAGLSPRAGWRFNPHLTLLHGRHEIDRWIDPISWTAAELVLLDSVVGARRHDVIAKWPLK